MLAIDNTILTIKILKYRPSLRPSVFDVVAMPPMVVAFGGPTLTKQAIDGWTGGDGHRRPADADVVAVGGAAKPMKE